LFRQNPLQGKKMTDTQPPADTTEKPNHQTYPPADFIRPPPSEPPNATNWPQWLRWLVSAIVSLSVLFGTFEGSRRYQQIVEPKTAVAATSTPKPINEEELAKKIAPLVAAKVAEDLRSSVSRQVREQVELETRANRQTTEFRMKQTEEMLKEMKDFQKEMDREFRRRDRHPND